MNDTAPEERTISDPAFTGAPASAPPAESAGPSPARPKPLPTMRGAIEWFWRGRSIRAHTAEALPAYAASAELRRRAQQAADLAEKTLLEPEPAGKPSADFIACELYRQAAYWCLAALEAPDPARARDFASVWRRADRRLLAAAAGSEEALAALEASLLAGSFDHYAQARSEEQARLAWQLRPLVAALLARVEAPRAGLDALRLERWLRIGLLLLVIAVPTGFGIKALDLREESQDMALGKPWRASSSGYASCKSPRQFCDESPAFFFHTADEKDPWLELDLGTKTRFSAVRVVNRSDCCRDRAVPLVIEVSDDQTKWKQVARRDSTFRSWKGSFAPVSARYVRLRVVGKTIFHLSSVRVLP